MQMTQTVETYDERVKVESVRRGLRFMLEAVREIGR